MKFNNKVFRLETKEGELILNVSQKDLEVHFLDGFLSKKMDIIKEIRMFVKR